ncbi:hypothetical protein EJ02DRAFT_514669 [Clathrospora elynae]|uniref:Uncharacterized protein n=1 Tax=Clathrospora elynae TaxID=706981 RepID=A0A6A5SER2_9PLEO|nr:hypothetical protein EJ02DRAFT_514669 [Clathrospora elynae]
MPPVKRRGSVNVSQTQRAAIITLRVVAEWNYDRIVRALGLPHSTCSSIVRRAEEATGNSDIIELLDYCAKENNREAAGKAATKVWPLSTTSVMIQDAAWWFPRETWDEAVHNHTTFADLSRRTIEHICRDQPHPLRNRRLTRMFEVHKPPLSNEFSNLSVDYARWCLFWLDKGALFVFTDETYIQEPVAALISGKR